MTFAEHEIIPESCKERFLPVSGAGCALLRSVGMSLSGLSDLRTGFVAERPAHRPLTKFEQRGLALGHPVRDILFRRRRS